MSDKVIVQSAAGEVRIEAEVVKEATRFRTYIKNTLQSQWNLDNQPVTSCTPVGVASYYVTKVRGDIKVVLTKNDIDHKVIQELIADMK